MFLPNKPFLGDMEKLHDAVKGARGSMAQIVHLDEMPTDFEAADTDTLKCLRSQELASPNANVCFQVNIRYPKVYKYICMDDYPKIQFTLRHHYHLLQHCMVRNNNFHCF